MTDRPTLRCLPGGLSERLPPALLSLASDDHGARLTLAHEDRLALAAHLLAGVHDGDLRPDIALCMIDALLDRRAPDA